jgi:hypothetical protein
LVLGCADTDKGYTIDMAYMNNFEYNKNSKEIYMSIQPVLHCTNGKLILSSTPRYKKDLFYNLWISAGKKESPFKRINVSWNENTYLNEEWYKKECRNLQDPDAIATELDGKFIKKKERKKSAINIRLEPEKKDKILERMKQKNISSITDYIMELIDKDLS